MKTVRKMNLMNVWLVIGLCLLGIHSQLQAMQITNVTDGVLKFDNAGFENDPLEDGPTYANPGWQRNYYPYDETIAAPAPGAFQGSKYVKSVRTAGDSGGPRMLFADWNNAGHEVFIENTPGKLIHAEWMAFYPSGNDSYIIIEGYNTYYRGVWRPNNGVVQAYNTTDGYHDTSLTYAMDTWQKWEIDYVVGADTATVRVGGNSLVSPTYADGSYGVQGGGDMYGIGFGHVAAGGLFYLDAVPEPASMLLLSVGGFLFGRRRLQR